MTLRLESGGGPDGLSARLLNLLSKALPNLVVGVIQEITLFEKNLQT